MFLFFGGKDLTVGGERLDGRLFIRTLLIAGGLLLAFPELYSNGIGLIVLIPAVALGKFLNRRVSVVPESG